MGFSIIVPVKALNDHIRKSIPIALALDHDAFEILIVPDDQPEDIPEALRDPRVRIFPSGPGSPALKRDLAAGHARHDVLAFIDDDAYPRGDWLRVAEAAMAEHGVECVGGPALTPPEDSLPRQASGLFYELRTGGGPLAYRYRPARHGFFVDDFPSVNLIVSKRAFQAVGGFQTDFWPGEDTKLCLDLVRAGYRIRYCPRLIVWHHRREILRPHLKQVGAYALHRGFFALKFPQTSRRLMYFLPSLFLLGNLALLGATLVWPAIGNLWAALLGIYALLVGADVGSRTRRPALFALTAATVVCSHLTYGFMFLRGLLTRELTSELR